MPSATFAPATPAQQRGVLGWLFGLMVVLICLLALSQSPASAEGETAEVDAFALLTEPPLPEVCTAEVDPSQDTVDRDAGLPAMQPVHSPAPALRLQARSHGSPQFQAPPPQRPPRALA